MNRFTISGFADEISESFDEQLRSFNKLNIPCIEIRGVDGKNITEYTLSEVKEMKRQLDAHNIRVSAIGSPIGKVFINESFEIHFDLFKHTVEIAKLLETQYIRLFSFYIPKDDNPDRYEEIVTRRLLKMTEYAKEHDVILLHENEKDIYGDIPSRCLKLSKSINSDYFKLIFDFANFIQCGIEPNEAYQLLKDDVIYFHIKDALHETKSVVPAGSGDGNIEGILKEAYNAGYIGYLSLEPHLGSFKGLSDLELDLELDENEIETDGFDKFQLAHRELFKLLLRIA